VPRRDPPLMIGREPASRHDAVHVRMSPPAPTIP
jgi:hypothetical protein